MRHFVLFPDVTNAQRLYDLLKAEGIRCTFAPTPREADKCCGVCVMFQNEEDRPEIERLIEENAITVLKFYEGQAGDPERMKFC